MLRAFYDWIVDNELTPHLVVDATAAHVIVPQQFVQDGQIVLNVSPSACVNFYLSPEGVSFQARFGGQPFQLSFPCSAVLAIYARENGAGTMFTPDTLEDTYMADTEMTDSDADSTEDEVADSQVRPPVKGKPTLSIVK
jgi:stringent starvation protein B